VPCSREIAAAEAPSPQPIMSMPAVRTQADISVRHPDFGCCPEADIGSLRSLANAIGSYNAGFKLRPILLASALGAVLASRPEPYLPELLVPRTISRQVSSST
jgi:hypothetical protein